MRQFLLNADLLVVEADFIATTPTSFNMPSKSPLAFTSKNAVTAFLSHPQHTAFLGEQAFCVGHSSKSLLDEAGFSVIAAENASQLVDLLALKALTKLTFFSGNFRLDTLPDGLKKMKVELVEVQVYQTVLLPVYINKPVEGVLFFSPSGVQSFLESNTLTNQVCFCIGATTANELQRITDNIIIANHATVENVVARCVQYFSNQYQQGRNTLN